VKKSIEKKAWEKRDEQVGAFFGEAIYRKSGSGAHLSHHRTGNMEKKGGRESILGKKDNFSSSNIREEEIKHGVRALLRAQGGKERFSNQKVKN